MRQNKDYKLLSNYQLSNKKAHIIKGLINTKGSLRNITKSELQCVISIGKRDRI